MSHYLRRIARWYVYELADPRDGLVFYVGKGCGNRIGAHEKEALKAGEACSEKVSKIKEIWAEGLEVVRIHVAFFFSEQDAYDFEAERVSEYGRDALTNIMPGGGASRQGGSFISRDKPRKPVTPLEVVKRMAAKENWLWWFAFWLRSAANRQKLEVVSGPKLHAAIFSVALKSVFPAAWKAIRSDEAAFEFIKPHLLRHGVEVR